MHPENSFFDLNYAKAASTSVLQVLESGYCGGLSPFVRIAEERLESVLLQPCRLVSNGTVALELSLRAIGVVAGQKVICSARSFVATANAIISVGAIPVFIDQDSTGLGMDPNALRKALNVHADARTVVIAHLYGSAPTLREIVQICQQEHCNLIEDAAQAFGCQLDGRALGTWGRLGTFSFFSNKTLSCGEGGCIAANNAEDVELIEQLRYHGARVNDDGEFVSQRAGTNARSNAMAAAVLCSQLDIWKDIYNTRLGIAKTYIAGLEDRSKHLSFAINTDGMPPPIWCAVLRKSNALGWNAQECAHLSRVFQRQGVACRTGMPWLVDLPHLKNFEMISLQDQRERTIELLFPIHQGMDNSAVYRVLNIIHATLQAGI